MKVFNPHKTTWSPLQVEKKQEDGTLKYEDVEGVQVELGYIEHGLMKKFKHEHSLALNAYSRIMSKVEEEKRLDKPLDEAELRALQEIEEVFESFNKDVVKHGVKGFTGISYDDNTPVKAEFVVDNGKQVLSDTTLNIFVLNKSVLRALSRQVLTHNKLPEDILGK
jgi:hypothetical protein